MKKRIKVILIFLVAFQFILFINFAKADIISINSGGSTNLIINPGKYIEGFFSGKPTVISVCGNGILEPSEECDDGNNIDGDGCSALCKIEKESGGGGGGGGGGGSDFDDSSIPDHSNIRLDPVEIQKTILINTNIEEEIIVLNLGRDISINPLVHSKGFSNDLMVKFWDEEQGMWVDTLNLYLSPREVYELRAKFFAPNTTGEYTGTIFVGDRKLKVTLDIQEKLLLFDSNIIILNKDYVVPQGNKLRTSVTLIPMMDEDRVDVTLNYFIRDYDNKVYLTRSETLLVENRVNFKRNFDTGLLPVGAYVLDLELIYPNGVAPSSAHFEIVENKQNTFFGKLVFFLVNSILVILALLIIFIVLRAIRFLGDKKKIQEQKKKLVDYFKGLRKR